MILNAVWKKKERIYPQSTMENIVCTYQEIAAAIGRSCDGVSYKIDDMRSNGKIKDRPV
jgi:predicted transcriptional regulator